MGPIEEMLRKAWKLIKKPKSRCVDTPARNAQGRNVDPKSAEACQWCCYGAADAVADRAASVHELHSYLAKASSNVFGDTFVSIHNDKDPVNNPPLIYKEAIRLAKEEGV